MPLIALNSARRNLRTIVTVLSNDVISMLLLVRLLQLRFIAWLLRIAKDRDISCSNTFGLIALIEPKSLLWLGDEYLWTDELNCSYGRSRFYARCPSLAIENYIASFSSDLCLLLWEPIRTWLLLDADSFAASKETSFLSPTFVSSAAPQSQFICDTFIYFKKIEDLSLQ